MPHIINKAPNKPLNLTSGLVLRQARVVEAVASIQRRSVEQGTDKILMDEINAEIKAVRNNQLNPPASL